MRRLWLIAAALLMLLPTTAIAADASRPSGRDAHTDPETLWRQLRQGGHVILVRHAQTEPGIGDPEGFRLEDCATQRNLSDVGRADARRMGEAFRSRAVPVAEVRSSRWCRCLDTARLAFGKVAPDPMLDSMFREDDQTGRPKVARVLDAISRHAGPGNLVLVTHSQNIIALTGQSVSSGEMLVLGPGSGSSGLRVLGTIAPGAY